MTPLNLLSRLCLVFLFGFGVVTWGQTSLKHNQVSFSNGGQLVDSLPENLVGISFPAESPYSNYASFILPFNEGLGTLNITGAGKNLITGKFLGTQQLGLNVSNGIRGLVQTGITDTNGNAWSHVYVQKIVTGSTIVIDNQGPESHINGYAGVDFSLTPINPETLAINNNNNITNILDRNGNKIMVVDGDRDSVSILNQGNGQATTESNLFYVNGGDVKFRNFYGNFGYMDVTTNSSVDYKPTLTIPLTGTQEIVIGELTVPANTFASGWSLVAIAQTSVLLVMPTVPVYKAESAIYMKIMQGTEKSRSVLSVNQFYGTGAPGPQTFAPHFNVLSKKVNDIGINLAAPFTCQLVLIIRNVSGGTNLSAAAQVQNSNAHSTMILMGLPAVN